jgi:hypothetical protein
MASTIRRLLDEVSWEGNASRYRGGGLGRENVLTAEVIQALDFLPRDAFLGQQALRNARGADLARDHAASDVENLLVDVLPGDLELPACQIRAQPDALLSSDHSYVFVEAKRIRTAAFQEEQLARELLLTAHHAAGRQPLLLLVLGEPPPIPVRGHGLLGIADAVRLGSELMSERLGKEVSMPNPLTAVAYSTWTDLADSVVRAADAYQNQDQSAVQAIRRIATSAAEAVSAHS